METVEALVAQSCLTLCDPTDWLTRLLCPWGSPGKNPGVGFAISSSGAPSRPRVSCTVSSLGLL